MSSIICQRDSRTGIRREIEFFTKQCGIPEDLLPEVHAGRDVFFPDGAPILIDNDGSPRFTCFDDSSVTLSRFERFLARYEKLFFALKAFELVYVSTSEKSFSAARSCSTGTTPRPRSLASASRRRSASSTFWSFCRPGSAMRRRGCSTSRDLRGLAKGRVDLYLARARSLLCCVDDSEHECGEDPGVRLFRQDRRPGSLPSYCPTAIPSLR